MKLTRTVVYAICATLELARAGPDCSICCRELAQRGRLPERFLLRILRILVTHGILRSTRGTTGGYCVSRPGDQITLLDIVDAFDESLHPRLPNNSPIVSKVSERLLRTLELTTHAARHELQNVTIADLLEAASNDLSEIKLEH